MNRINHGVPPEEWDAQLSQRHGSVLQGVVWAEFQKALGRDVVYAQGDGYQWLGGIRRSHGLNYLMCSYGPSADSLATMKSAMESVVEAARGLNLDFVRIEPQMYAALAMLRKFGAQPIAEADPTYTRVIDLERDEERLRSELDSGHRNRINGTERRGITIRHSERHTDFKIFLDMLHDTATRSKVTFYPDEYFNMLRTSLDEQGVLRLYMAEVEGQPVAAALFYDWWGTRYYAHAGAYQEANRKHKASVSLVWQAMLDAKANGLKKFDLWGVAPEGDESHQLASISHFKRGFGGELIEYGGTWDIPIKTGKYRLYQLYRRARGRA